MRADALLVLQGNRNREDHIVSRPNLKLAAKRKTPSLSLIKKALRLYSSEYASKAVRHANARKWLAMIAHLGPHWVYAGRTEVAWGAKQERNAK